MAAAATHGKPVDAYVTVLSDVDSRRPGPARPQALLDAGASRLSLYHLGLAPAWRQGLFADILDAVR